ncbi:MAG TPA: helix-turn-helix transcriptional regulator [Actinomycetota bacterium]|nr:helix-turn-helix transcriptional regulator [Actinomycetota bacterium]
MGCRTAQDPVESLTDREEEVLALRQRDCRTAEYRDRLFLGQKTVETHVRNIFMKLDIPEDPEGHRGMLAVLKILHSEIRVRMF